MAEKTRQMTVSLSAGETTSVEFGSYTAVDIFNGTEGLLYVNNTGDFDGTDYFVIPSGGAYNGYAPEMSGVGTVYLKAEVAGDVSLVSNRPNIKGGIV